MNYISVVRGNWQTQTEFRLSKVFLGLVTKKSSRERNNRSKKFRRIVQKMATTMGGYIVCAARIPRWGLCMTEFLAYFQDDGVFLFGE